MAQQPAFQNRGLLAAGLLALVASPVAGVMAKPSAPEAAIQATVDQFRADLGGVNNGSPRGALFATTGSAARVSMDDDTLADADPGQVRFNHLSAAYASGSGDIFAGVDYAAGTRIEFFDALGQSLGSFGVPAANNGLSFLGVSFTAGERAAQVRLTLGNTPLGPGESGAIDVAALDDFTYGEPQGIPSATLYAVTTANQLVRLADAVPGTLLGSVAITGLQPGESILAIDVRPATGQLFALGGSSRLYTLDESTGAATLVGSGAFSPGLSGVNFGMDFSPVADRIRVVSNAEQNLRLNPTTGAAVVDLSLNPASNVVAAAYDRNFLGAGATTLFGIDSLSDQLVRIGGVDGSPSANSGAVTNLGALGVDTSGLAGLDIARSGQAYALLTVGTVPVPRLYQVNLATGAAALLGTIGTGSVPIRDIAAALPPNLYLPLVSN